MIHRRLPLILMVLVGTGATALARESKEAPIKPFAFSSYSGQVYFKGFTTSEKRIETNGNTTKETRQREWFFEEGIELNTRSYIYHPNLLDLTASGRLAKTQEQFEINQDIQKTKGDLKDYSISALLLKEKPVSLRGFALREESLQARDYARGTSVIQTRRGGEFRVNGDIPMTLLAERIKIHQEDDQRITNENTQHYRTGIEDRRNRDWLTSLVYDRQRTAKTAVSTPDQPLLTFQEFPETIDEVTFTNNWRFGPKDLKSSLSGTARSQRQDGFFQDKTRNLSERLDLAHTKTFSTFYIVDYSFDDVETDKDSPTSQDQSERFEAGMTKKIYDSLDVTLRGYQRHRTIDQSLENSGGAFLETAYRKKTLLGQYTSTLQLGREKEHDMSGTGTQSIRDESVTLVGLAFVQLSKTNIVAGSIRVTDTTRTIVYVSGVDYTTQTTGITTEIARVLGGAIADGQTVLVSYSIDVVKEDRFHRNTFDWTNRMKLDKLPVSVYTNYRRRRAVLDDGEDPGNLEDDRNLLSGVELDYKGLRATIEHEIQDLIYSPPWVSNRVAASYHYKLGNSTEMSIGADARHVQYQQAAKFHLEPGAEVLDTVGARTGLTTKLTRNSLLRFSSDLVSTSGRDNRSELRNAAAFEWRYGKLEMSVEAAYNVFDQQNIAGTSRTTGTDASVRFNLRRRF